MDLIPDEWLATLRREYLAEYIPAGGAAVKFAVTRPGIDRGQLRQDLRAAAEAAGCVFALVDAAATRVHLIDQVFHAAARQLDWPALAHRFLAATLREQGWHLPPEADELTLSRLAGLNGRLPDLARNEVSGILERAIYDDPRLCREFRIAMIRLCQGRLDPGLSPVPPEAIIRWLQGRPLRLSEVKAAPLFHQVARHNARYLLESLSVWLRRCLCHGLVLVLEIDRCLQQHRGRRDPADPSHRYTASTCRDAYEGVRELVDQTDALEHALVVVLAPPEFLDPDHRRSVWRYDALKLRIWDEVRDEHRPNPLAALLRLSPARSRTTPEAP